MKQHPHKNWHTVRDTQKVPSKEEKNGISTQAQKRRTQEAKKTHEPDSD